MVNALASNGPSSVAAGEVLYRMALSDAGVRRSLSSRRTLRCLVGAVGGRGPLSSGLPCPWRSRALAAYVLSALAGADAAGDALLQRDETLAVLLRAAGAGWGVRGVEGPECIHEEGTPDARFQGLACAAAKPSWVCGLTPPLTAARRSQSSSSTNSDLPESLEGGLGNAGLSSTPSVSTRLPLVLRRASLRCLAKILQSPAAGRQVAQRLVSGRPLVFAFQPGKEREYGKGRTSKSGQSLADSDHSANSHSAASRSCLPPLAARTAPAEPAGELPEPTLALLAEAGLGDSDAAVVRRTLEILHLTVDHLPHAAPLATLAPDSAFFEAGVEADLQGGAQASRAGLGHLFHVASWLSDKEGRGAGDEETKSHAALPPVRRFQILGESVRARLLALVSAGGSADLCATALQMLRAASAEPRLRSLLRAQRAGGVLRSLCAPELASREADKAIRDAAGMVLRAIETGEDEAAKAEETRQLCRPDSNESFVCGVAEVPEPAPPISSDAIQDTHMDEGDGLVPFSDSPGLALGGAPASSSPRPLAWPRFDPASPALSTVSSPVASASSAAPGEEAPCPAQPASKLDLPTTRDLLDLLATRSQPDLPATRSQPDLPATRTQPPTPPTATHCLASDPITPVPAVGAARPASSHTSASHETQTGSPTSLMQLRERLPGESIEQASLDVSADDKATACEQQFKDVCSEYESRPDRGVTFSSAPPSQHSELSSPATTAALQGASPPPAQLARAIKTSPTTALQQATLRWEEATFAGVALMSASHARTGVWTRAKGAPSTTQSAARRAVAALGSAARQKKEHGARAAAGLAARGGAISAALIRQGGVQALIHVLVRDAAEGLVAERAGSMPFVGLADGMQFGGSGNTSPKEYSALSPLSSSGSAASWRLRKHPNHSDPIHAAAASSSQLRAASPAARMALQALLTLCRNEEPARREARAVGETVLPALQLWADSGVPRMGAYAAELLRLLLGEEAGGEEALRTSAALASVDSFRGAVYERASPRQAPGRPLDRDLGALDSVTLCAAATSAAWQAQQRKGQAPGHEKTADSAKLVSPVFGSSAARRGAGEALERRASKKRKKEEAPRRRPERTDSITRRAQEPPGARCSPVRALSSRSASFEGSVRLLDSRVVLGGLSDANGLDSATLGDIAWSDAGLEPARDGAQDEIASKEARALRPRVRPRRPLSECPGSGSESSCFESPSSPSPASPEPRPPRAAPVPPDAFESASSAALACEEGKDDWLVEAADITLCVDEQGLKVHLGEGGFGVVVKGLLHGVDEVAVKRVRTDRPSKTQLATFHHEVHALRHLCHRNVVQFYGACLNPGNLFLVTELMGGGDLYSTLRRQPHVMAWRTLGRRVALDIALGLHYLHTRRPPVVHRDLKSPNILLTSEGVAKIADVGMSRRLVTNLVTAQPIMTPLWAAPEVLRRERTSAAADVWSLGVLVWEIATRVDITRFQPLAMARGVGGGAGTLEMTPDAPRLARHIFESCTQLDPAARPSAGTIVEWLKAED